MQQPKDRRFDMGDAAVFAAVFGFITLKFAGIFQNMELPGWDTPGHYAAFVKMATEYLPSGHLSGYAPEWLGGISLFRFYGPTYFALLAGLWWVVGKTIPLALLFRLGAFAAVCLVPLALWDLSRVRYGRDAARWTLALALLFVFYPKAYSSIGIGASAVFWVGFIPSTVGLAVSFFTLAWAERLRRAPSLIPQFVLTLLIALLVTGHTVSFMVTCGLLAVVALCHLKDTAYLRRLGISVGLGIAMSLWWLVPFIQGNSLTSTKTLATASLAVPLWQHFFPTALPYFWAVSPFVALAILIGGVMLWRKGDRMVIALIAATVFGVSTRSLWGSLLPDFTFHYYRIIPFAYLLLLLVASYALAEGARVWGEGAPRRQAYLAVVLIAVIGISAMAYDFRVDYRPGDENGRDTLAWRWDEYPLIPQADALSDKLAAMPELRRILPVSVTASAIATLGSPSYFASRLPLHGGPDLMTGVYTESSPLTPFALAAAEAFSGEGVWYTGDQRLKYVTPFTAQPREVQLDRLRSMGMDSLFADDTDIVTGLRALPDLVEVAGVDPFHVFAVADPEPLVSAPAQKPLLYVDLDARVPFRDTVFALFAGERTYRVPMIDGGRSLAALAKIGADQVSAIVVSGGEASRKKAVGIVGEATPVIALAPDFELLPRTLHRQLPAWPRGWEELQKAVVDLQAAKLDPGSATVSAEASARFTFDAPGPVIVKRGYDPRWIVEEGEGDVFMVSPGFIFVTGEGPRTLAYRTGSPLLTAISILAFLALPAQALWQKQRKRKTSLSS